MPIFNKVKLHKSLSILIAIFLSLTVIQSAFAYTNYISEKTLSPISVLSTRSNIPSNTQPPLNTTQLVLFTLWKFGAGCPQETAIYIHGWNRDDVEAREEFNRIEKSLNHNNYKIPLVGLSWNSKIDYPTAQNNAKNNGLELAKYISDFKKECPDTHIRIIAHSLGSAIINSTLISLYQDLQTNSKVIKSVHLLGATINNMLIAKNSLFGNATEHVVDKFYNLYNNEDDGLEFSEIYEGHAPLGLHGAQSDNGIPVNYNETNVAYEIPPISDADGDGNVEECFEEINPAVIWGDNHCGYIGFRQPSAGSLIDDGAMNVVVRDWLKP